MPRSTANKAIARVAGRLPGLRRLPVFKLLALGEVAVLAREHLQKLEPDERHRLVELVKRGRLRPSNLTRAEREELASLLAKMEPGRFAGSVADKLSPVPLPRRMAGRRES